MRRVMDAGGVEWSVFEVRREGARHRWEYLPDGFEDGWLCFESRYGKRRLTPIPPDWRQANADELRRMLSRARPGVSPRTASEERPARE